jgi:hypothetical protein
MAQAKRTETLAKGPARKKRHIIDSPPVPRCTKRRMLMDTVRDWWTPVGWLAGTRPPQWAHYREARETAAQGGLLNEELEGRSLEEVVGYRPFPMFWHDKGPPDKWEVVVHEAEAAAGASHLWVRGNVYGCGLRVEFFVAEMHWSAFMVDALPSMVERFARLSEVTDTARQSWPRSPALPVDDINSILLGDRK